MYYAVAMPDVMQVVSDQYCGGVENGSIMKQSKVRLVDDLYILGESCDTDCRG